jgi:tRNA pseudouridine55 synthase
MDGIVVIDKPAGLTSHDVVSRVKKILGVKKAGHTGTLDPLATGVLPVCLGEATKLARFLSVENKMYRADMLLGVRTDTQDIEGAVLKKSSAAVSEEDIKRAFSDRIGKIKQIPPAYSAVKHKGKPLYKYARQGQFPDIAPRDVEIFKIDVLKISVPTVTFEIVCSKGTYIRTLCAEIGEALNCGACLAGLRRLQSGCFTEAAAVGLDGDTTALRDRFLAKMLRLSQCLPAMPAVGVDGVQAARLKAGFQPDAEMIGAHVPAFLAAGDMIKLVDPEGRLVAVAELILDACVLGEGPAKRQAAKIVRVFHEG